MVYAYYNNPRMFKIQQELWNQYPPEVLKDFEIIVVDDCSSEYPLKDHIIPERKFDMKCWRVTVNVPWNWIACRNKGAFEAEGKWIFHTDIDLAWHPETAKKIHSLIIDEKLEDGVWYTFDRIIMPEKRFYKAHPNSYLMRKDLYWRIGGYDEEYCGYYGSDGSYRRRCVMFADDFKHLHGYPLHYYPKRHYPDSGSPDIDHIRFKDKGKDRAVLQRSRQNITNYTKPLTMTYKYDRVL